MNFTQKAREEFDMLCGQIEEEGGPIKDNGFLYDDGVECKLTPDPIRAFLASKLQEQYEALKALVPEKEEWKDFKQVHDRVEQMGFNQAIDQTLEAFKEFDF